MAVYDKCGKPIKSSVRDDFKRGLQNIMKKTHAEFADGTFEDNMVDIYDNYVSQYYEKELEEDGGEAVAEDWFRNTYFDDDEGIFIHNSRKPIKSEMTSRQYRNAVDKAARMITEGERNVDLICKKTGLDKSDVESIIEEQEEMESAFSSRKSIKSSVDKQRVKEELNYPYYNIENPERFYDIQFDINWEDIPAFATSWNKCIDIDPKEIVSVEYDDSVPASYQDVNNMDYDAIDGAYLVKFKDGTSKSYGWTYGGDKLKLMSSIHSSRKSIKSSNLIKSNVEIDDNIFIELLWDRVRSFTPAKGYDDEFWTECFDYLSDVGWMEDPWKNNPKYIVDNIAVNGEIFALEDCADNYDEINDDYEGDVNAWIEDNGYLVFGDYVVIDFGL